MRLPLIAMVHAAASASAGGQMLVDLRVEGPTAVIENSTTDYTAVATFSNGDEFEVTLFSEWSVAPDEYAVIDQFGYLMTDEVPEDQAVVVQAAFTWDGVTETGTLDVTIVDLTEDPEDDPWPEWQRNRFRWGRTSSKGPRTPRIQWSIQFDATGASSDYDGSMALDVEGRLFAPAYEGLTCIDTVNREILWEFNFLSSIDRAPSLHDGRVLFGSPNDNFYCLDAATGEELWSIPAEPHPNRGQVVDDSMPGGVVYFASGLGTLYARSIEDGSEVWTVNIDGITDCAPSLDGLGRLFLGENDGVLVRAHGTSNGLTLWEAPSGLCVMRTVPTDASRAYAAFRTYPGPLLCLETEMGDELWAFQGIAANTGATAVGHDGTIFFAEAIEAARLFSISPSGQLLWTYAVDQQVLNPPIVDGDGRIYFGTVLANTIGQVHAVNPDGTAAWVLDMPNKCQPSPILAPDGTLYVSCKDKRVYAFKDPAKGDVTVNDVIDGRDIRAFIRVLYGIDDDPIKIFAADMDDDGDVDLEDVPLFVEVLLNESP